MTDMKKTKAELCEELARLRAELAGMPRPVYPEGLRRYTVAELGDKVILHGRMPKGDAPVLWHTGSGIELSVKASQLWLELEAAWTGSEEYVRVTVNGFEAARALVMPGVTRLCIYRRLPADEVHTVRLYKEMQAFCEEGHHLTVRAILTDGEVVAPPQRRWRFEVIGDSITSGEGLGGAQCETAWCPYSFSSRGGYAFLVGEALDANVDVMAFSGQGICCNGWNDPRFTLPRRYGYVVGPRVKGVGASEEFDPAPRGYDAVIVNLGTNDLGAPNRPPFEDPETGESFALKRGEDKLYTPESRAHVLAAATGFMETLRKRNPRLRAIVMVYGMMNPSEEIAEIYREAAEQAGGGITTVLRVPTMDKALPGMVGSRRHPGPEAHKAAAAAIVAHVRELGF